MKYKVQVKKVLEGFVEVDADSVAEANEKAYEKALRTTISGELLDVDIVDACEIE